MTLTGVEQIEIERIRQVEAEGWTAEHDDKHGAGELAKAADHYVMYAERQISGYHDPDIGMPTSESGSYYGWPWDSTWWKPSEDPIRNLVVAGALIAAEIDRLQRAAQ